MKNIGRSLGFARDDNEKMFTGLVQDIGVIRSIDREGDWIIEIATALHLDAMPKGASLCCSGCCLTMLNHKEGAFTVEVSAETLSKTTLSDWHEGLRINLEPSLKLGDELGGHLVFGHVDGRAEIIDLKQEGESCRVQIAAPLELAHYIAPKGSVALDGVSLTVNEVSGNRFGVNIIPHTWAHTTFQDKKIGDILNIEIDMLARYVARMLGKV